MNIKQLTIITVTLNLIIGIYLLSGCKITEPKRLETINAMYLDIKTIVTDPGVQPLIPEETMARLAKLERIYLQAAMRLQKAQTAEDWAIGLSTIVDCGTCLVEIVDTFVLDGQYAAQIQAVKLGVKMLKNHIT